MKVASKLVLLFNDLHGFSSSIFYSLQPHAPHSSLLRSEEKFELSLEQYGIKDQKACGDIANFVDDKGQLQVSMLLVQHYDPPILVCVINEIFKSIGKEPLPSTRTLVLPYILPAARLKFENKKSSVDNKNASLYGIHLGQAADFSQGIVRTAEKPPLSLQICYEPLACLLQFVHVLNIPTALLIGKRGTREEHEVLHEMGELLAKAFGLRFEKDRIKLDLGKTTIVKEPWRALYG